MNDEFAMVTGASQGLGLAICEALAKRRYNLVMVSLPDQQLDEKASNIRRGYNVDVFIYETDLTELINCEKLLKELTAKKITIGILINNAGIGSNGRFTSFDSAFYYRQIALNCGTPVLLCRLLIPQMLPLPQAYILNIGSLGAFFDMPNKEVYVASKAFLVSFTRSLRASLKKTSIKVSVVCPGSIETNDRLKAIHKEIKGIAKRSIMHPEEVAEEAINGMFMGKKVFIPGMINRFFYGLNRFLPEKIQLFFIDREMQRQENLKLNVGEMLRKV